MKFRVMIAAVNKSNTDLKLHFFNNCFQTWFGEERLKLNKSKFVLPTCKIVVTFVPCGLQ